MVGVDTENKRRSAGSLLWHVIPPVPDGNIGSADRRHTAGIYRGAGGATRDLASIIAAATTLSQVELLLGTLRELAATMDAATSTGTPPLDVLRELAGAIAATTTTSAAQTDVLREATSTIAATTALSQIELITATLRELATTVAATTTTAASELTVLRELTSTLVAQSASSASIKVLRELSAMVAAGTSLTDIELLIGTLRELAATINTTTTTSTPPLNVLRTMSAQVDAATTTSGIAITMVRALSAQVAAGADVGDVVVLVLREMSAQIDAVTLASAIDLVLAAATLITDTQIQSITTKRLIEST